MKIMTYEFLVLTAVRNADVGLSCLIDEPEREVPHIGLDFSVIELAADETLSIENTSGQRIRTNLTKRVNKHNIRIMRVQFNLILSRVTDQTLIVGERDV